MNSINSTNSTTPGSGTPSAAKIDLVLGGPYAALPELARQVESRGFDGVWVGEATQDPIVQSTVIAGATSRVTIGTNITLAFPRSPTATAIAAWDLAELSGDRFIMGLGSQVRRIIEERFSAQFAHPARRMGEYVQAMRAVYAMERGEQATFEGEFYRVTRPSLNGLGRAGDRPLPPTYIAAVGPLMTDVATGHADGLLGHPFVSMEYLTGHLLPRLEKGLAGAGRARRDFTLAQGLIVSVSEDRDEAIRHAKQQIAFYGATPNYAPIFAANGDEEIQQRLNAVFKSTNRDVDALVACVPDEAATRYAVAGTPQEVRERVAAYSEVADRLLLSGAWFKMPTAAMATNMFNVMEALKR